jgi:tRNA-specific 2-thiouridylase
MVVAMSGGVDSSVVAGLMHEAGHEVIGITLQLYNHGAAVTRQATCCAGRDIEDARAVADRMGFAHYVIDAEERFRQSVIEDFAESYANGETPVPCVRCNQGVKFTDLAKMARELGADALATGHYVRRIEGINGAELHRAVDEQRDQSWFLFATTRAQLEFCRFPLGGYASKAEVRAEAQRLGLRVAEKPDSQDLCFVPSGSYAELATNLRPAAGEAGEIVLATGEVVGRHDGIARFTVGQSKRLGNAAQINEERFQVVALDPATRRVVIGPKTEGTVKIQLREMNWLIAPPAAGVNCTVKLRARDKMRSAHVSVDGAVTLAEAALPAPGQACVMYDGDHVLGGGFIMRSLPGF